MMKKLLILILLIGFTSNSQTKLDTVDLKFERICYAFEQNKNDSVKFIKERFFKNDISKSITYDFNGKVILESIKANINTNEIPFYRFDYKSLYSNTIVNEDIQYKSKAYFDKFGFPDSIQITDNHWKYFKKTYSKKGKILGFESDDFKYTYKYNIFGKLKSAFAISSSNDKINYVFKKGKLTYKSYNDKKRICTYDNRGNLIMDRNEFERKLVKKEFNSSLSCHKT